jgi:hypothetical protein
MRDNIYKFTQTTVCKLRLAWKRSSSVLPTSHSPRDGATTVRPTRVRSWNEHVSHSCCVRYGWFLSLHRVEDLRLGLPTLSWSDCTSSGRACPRDTPREVRGSIIVTIMRCCLCYEGRRNSHRARVTLESSAPGLHSRARHLAGAYLDPRVLGRSVFVREYRSGTTRPHHHLRSVTESDPN